MKFRILPFLTILVYSFSSFCQEPKFDWNISVGDQGSEYAKSIATDFYGNTYSVGEFTDTVDFDPTPSNLIFICQGSTDLFITKYDIQGNYVWAKQIGGSGYDFVKDIITDTLGNMYITGSFSNTVDFDPNTGVSNLSSQNGFDAFVLKLDSGGNFQWVTQGSNTGTSSGEEVTLDAVGNVYTTGYFYDTLTLSSVSGNSIDLISNGEIDYFISKRDSQGNLLWAKSFGGKYNDESFSLIADINGNCYVTGFFIDTVDFNPGPAINMKISNSESKDIFLQKLDASGNLIYINTFGSKESSDRGLGLTTDEFGNVYLSGQYSDTVDFDPSAIVHNIVSIHNTAIQTASDIFICKYDMSGQLVWVRSIGGDNYDWFNDISYDGFGNIVLAGRFSGNSIDINPDSNSTEILYNPNQGNFNFFVESIDAAGNFNWGLQNSGLTSFAVGLNQQLFCAGRVNKNFLALSIPPYQSYHSFGGLADFTLLKLSVCNAMDDSITINAGTLSVPFVQNQTYQWFDCSSNLPVQGANSSSFIPSNGGNYNVIISNGTCSDTSQCVVVTGINNLNVLNLGIRIYPNPTNNLINIRQEKASSITIQILDITGKVLLTKSSTNLLTTVDLKGLSNGIYIMKVSRGTTVSVQKIIKR